MVDADLVSLTGDYAQCRGGMTIAQNLPNNDKLALKTGGGRRNVYHRQVRLSDDPTRTQKMLEAFLHKDFHKYYDKEADHIFVIGHENGHSLGPKSEYQNSPGIYKSIIEENKADMVALSMLDVLTEAGLYTPEEKLIATDTLKALIPTLELRKTWYDKVIRVMGDNSKYSVDDLESVLAALEK
jgi:hypothetical protein